MLASPFHEDEIAAQARARVHPYAAGIRPFMPDEHREFFPLLRYLFAAVPDQSGWPLATVLIGPAGFVRAPSSTVLRIDSLPLQSDPAMAGFASGNEIGILGLDLSSRRRNRANGRISAIDGDGFSVDITQSFGNCAQYIQTRCIRSGDGQPAGPSVVARGVPGDDARRLISAGDTFFVASRSRANVGSEGGLDMSHRGGKPGFIRIEGDSLFIPDFKGNRFFNTLGNFLGDNRAGLLFIDFENGNLLQITGTVTIDWNPRATGTPAGMQRFWRVDVERSWWRPGALPFVWEFGDYAPTTLATGVWQEFHRENLVSLPPR